MSASRPEPELADWTLAAQVKAGDDRAFEVLMTRYKRPILHFVHRMTGNEAEAEDAAQTVFVRAYRGMRRPGFGQTRAAFSTWLFQIARNASLDVLRHRRRHPTISLDAAQETGVVFPDRRATAAADAEQADVGRRIAAAIAKLPEDQRTAIVLSEYEDRPQAEIAAILRCSEKSVEGRLYRARQTLRRLLADLL